MFVWRKGEGEEERKGEGMGGERGGQWPLKESMGFMDNNHISIKCSSVSKYPRRSNMLVIHKIVLEKKYIQVLGVKKKKNVSFRKEKCLSLGANCQNACARPPRTQFTLLQSIVFQSARSHKVS